MTRRVYEFAREIGSPRLVGRFYCEKCGARTTFSMRRRAWSRIFGEAFLIGRCRRCGFRVGPNECGGFLEGTATP